MISFTLKEAAAVKVVRSLTQEIGFQIPMWHALKQEIAPVDADVYHCRCIPVIRLGT